MRDVFILTLIILLCSCSNNSQTSSEKATASDSTITNQSTSTINFQETDSIEFIYFPDPKDQRQYHNFFIRDKRVVDQLVANVSLPAASKEACAHDAKFYLFNNGEVFKTIYYSDSCKYLAYAVNSKQQFVNLSSESAHLLDSLMQVAPIAQAAKLKLTKE